LDVFEASLKGIDISASRPRLEHAQIITQADRERLGKLGGTLCFPLRVCANSEEDFGSNREHSANSCVSSFQVLCDLRLISHPPELATCGTRRIDWYSNPTHHLVVTLTSLFRARNASRTSMRSDLSSAAAQESHWGLISLWSLLIHLLDFTLLSHGFLRMGNHRMALADGKHCLPCFRFSVNL
jgi:hypothetical protein